MIIEVTKSYRFEAAHSLPFLPLDHKCHRVHGHSYEILVGVKGELLPAFQWVQDYAEISRHVEPLIKQLDHKNLNEALGSDWTTAEALAMWFAHKLGALLPLSRIEVRETPTSNAILRLASTERSLP